jgi:hypothetical protein
MLDKPAMKVWFTMLQDIDFKIAENAVMEHISTCKYPPSIADIRRLCMARCNPPILSYLEAWNTVLLAISTYGFEHYKEACTLMDDLTLEVVKGLGWYNVCYSTNADVLRATFKTAYEDKARERESKQMLPAFVLSNRTALQAKHTPIAVKREVPVIETKQVESLPPTETVEMIEKVRNEVRSHGKQDNAGV